MLISTGFSISSLDLVTCICAIECCMECRMIFGFGKCDEFDDFIVSTATVS